MRIVASLDPMNKVYHLPQCKGSSEIPYIWRMPMEKDEADRMGLTQCERCAGLAGFMNVFGKELALRQQTSLIKITYIHKTKTMYLRTGNGFWKVFWKEGCGYVLHHLNTYKPEASFEELAHGKFHRQGDVRPTGNVMKLIAYVEAHDTAKKIIEDDYRKLPQETKRQKKYYRIAARKDRGRQIRKVYQIFEEIEKGTNLRELSFC